MTLATLVLRGLVHYRRSHAAVLCGAALSSAILVGALAVGDSVRATLRQNALQRLGSTRLAMHSGDRFVRQELAGRLSAKLGAKVSAAAMLRGAVTTSDGEASAGKVQILFPDRAFWEIVAPEGATTRQNDALIESGLRVWINDALATRLNVKTGDEVLVRAEKPSLLSRDAPLSTIEDSSVAARLRVAGIVPRDQGGRFGLAANQAAPLTAFAEPGSPLLADLGIAGRVNLLLVGAGNASEPSAQEASKALWGEWTFEDVGLSLRSPSPGTAELQTQRVFLDPASGTAAMQALPGARGILTYFVNELRLGGRSTPYSAVTAMAGNPVPSDLKDDEIILNAWTAEDLAAKPGDQIRIRYWVVGPMRRLVERTAAFRVRSVIPISGAAADPGLMPNIPGLSDKKNCREWEPGVPIDLDRIRDKDQVYWDRYRGTPKAFISLSAGQWLWNNRFGNLTAIRYPKAGKTEPEIEACVRQALNPASMGLFFLPVREQALAASAPSFDFGQLFLGFSLFLIVGALVLTALLFGFGAESRAPEAGLLRAAGFTPRAVRKLLLTEAGCVALAGVMAGAPLGALFTRGVLFGLSGAWSGAVSGAEIRFSIEPSTPLVGAISAFLLSLVSVYFVSRGLGRAPVRALLGGAARIETPASKAANRASRILQLALFAGSAALLGHGIARPDSGAGAFFGGGFCLLSALLLWNNGRLRGGALPPETNPLSLASLARRAAFRRPGRSLACIATVGCGAFLVAAVGGSAHDPTEHANSRSSGTGGFALYAETGLPVYEDLNTESGLEKYGLEKNDLASCSVVPLRVLEGDDASCLNLNRAQRPQLLGVDPASLASRGAFRLAQTVRVSNDIATGWQLLGRQLPNDEVPVIGDVNTVVWSLGKSLGQTIDYTDETGRTRKLRIVAIADNWILQGALVMAEDRFVRLFPGQSGFRAFLIDAPNRPREVARTLTRGLEDQGFSAESAAERLAAFAEVEATYLRIFGALGTLGMLLGCGGIGVVVLRNILERRAEFAILRALGFTGSRLRQLILREHLGLLVSGLGSGALAAAMALLPAARSSAGSSLLGAAASFLVILCAGTLWVWVASFAVQRGAALQALREE